MNWAGAVTLSGPFAFGGMGMATVRQEDVRRVQVRARRKDAWTKAQRTKFLTVLAETCNGTAAARAVGKTEDSARSLRRRDGAFLLLWEEALQAGYDRLEAALLARALGQGPNKGDNPSMEEVLGATKPEAHDFDPALAIKVLQLHGDRRERRVRGKQGVVVARKTQGEVDAALLARLDALAARRK